MTESRFPKACWFLFIVVTVLASGGRACPATEAEPSLREFFQRLVQQYNSSALPKFEDLSNVEKQVADAHPEDISQALPAVVAALSHRDYTVRAYAASALLAISLRQDSAELMDKYLCQISNLFDDSDPRLQGMPELIFSQLRPAPPPKVFPLLLAFLRRTDRDPKAQVSAMGYLLHRAPENPEVAAAVMQLWSRPMDEEARIFTLNGLANSRSKRPHIINLVISSLDDRDFNIRETAFRALTRMGPAALQQAKLPMQKLADDYLALVRRNDVDPSTQVSAIEDLLYYAPEDPQVLNALVKFYSRPLYSGIRTGALDALRFRHIKDIRLIDLVIASLHDPNPEVRSTTAYVLADMGPEALLRAQPALREVAGDPAEPADVKEAAGKALKAIPGVTH